MEFSHPCLRIIDTITSKCYAMYTMYVPVCLCGLDDLTVLPCCPNPLPLPRIRPYRQRPRAPRGTQKTPADPAQLRLVLLSKRRSHQPRQHGMSTRQWKRWVPFFSSWWGGGKGGGGNGVRWGRLRWGRDTDEKFGKRFIGSSSLAGVAAVAVAAAVKSKRPTVSCYRLSCYLVIVVQRLSTGHSQHTIALTH